jgi:hypothetical protein
MRRSSKKLPKDPNMLAAEIVRISTDESPDPAPHALSAYFSMMGRKGGKKGGRARALMLGPKERTAIAKKAAKARWKAR